MKGIYRVSGNKADVESVHQKFEEDPNQEFLELGLTIHAVTGALKSFFTKLPGALIPSGNYDGIIAATSKFNPFRLHCAITRPTLLIGSLSM